ncbi:unnamed protein product [Cochlearia groenlandica]
MGRVARWFKGLFGSKKFRERQSRVSGEDSDKGGKDSCDENLTSDSVLLGTFLTDTEKENDKHAIAVAIATSTAAEAAVSAAEAAATAVRLIGERRVANITTRDERFAAIIIQKNFRGSLARKALRALKGIVKLQALVRGYLVRKRAAAMLQSIQTLIRVQTAMRSKRINRCLSKDYNMSPRQSLDKFDEATRDERSLKVFEIDDFYKKRSSSRSKSRQVHNVGALYDLEPSFSVDKWKFATAQNTPRFSTSSHNHNGANNRYYVMASPAKSVCGNVLCDYNGVMSTPGYMEKTQSFKAKLRSHSAPRQRSERKRLSLDEVIAPRSCVNGMSLEQTQQQQQQRFSCSYDPL